MFAPALDAAPAQDPPPRTPEKVVEMLGAKLSLSDDQKARIEPVIRDRQQKLAELKSDTSMRPIEKKRKLKSILDDSDKKIKALLNDEQKKQYTRVEQEMRDLIREPMQNRAAN